MKKIISGILLAMGITSISSGQTAVYSTTAAEGENAAYGTITNMTIMPTNNLLLVKVDASVMPKRSYRMAICTELMQTNWTFVGQTCTYTNTNSTYTFSFLIPKTENVFFQLRDPSQPIWF